MGMESADTSPQFILSGPHFQSLHVRNGPHFIPKSTKNLSKILGQSAGESPQFLLSAFYPGPKKQTDNSGSRHWWPFRQAIFLYTMALPTISKLGFELSRIGQNGPRSFVTSCCCLVEQDWRYKNGLPRNPNAYGPLTDKPSVRFRVRA
ncbi:hypothetical protein OUZ56_012505 [Daphnia magna]|uniref:Uncharacterized protein n=1 Tax=Daphnia magna TaxID=35525 RepID=A0ABQ9Z4E8_9CRUS|nr:hypothetical protein OUZ56_012505 [Daphnia magna]